jgi:hypothetical protein
MLVFLLLAAGIAFSFSKFAAGPSLKNFPSLPQGLLFVWLAKILIPVVVDQVQ